MHTRILVSAFPLLGLLSVGLPPFGAALYGQEHLSTSSPSLDGGPGNWTVASPQQQPGLHRAATSSFQAQESGTEGTNRLKATLIGAGVGLVVGGVVVWDLLELDPDPDDDFSETYYLIEGMSFWKAVGIGAAVGATAGAIIAGTAFGPYRSSAGNGAGRLQVAPLLAPRRLGASLRLPAR